MPFDVYSRAGAAAAFAPKDGVLDGGTASAPLYDIRIRHDDTAGWAAEDPVLSLGEEGIDVDTGTRKVGDGVTAWSSLPASGGGGGAGGAAAVQVTLDAADFFPDALIIPANATLVEVLPITGPISATIEDADDGAGFILHLAGGASNVTFTNAYPEGTFEDEVWATVVRASGAWRVFATDSGALANLSDVSLWGGQQDGDALLWNDGTQRWEAGTVLRPTTTKLSHLTDVDDGLDSADDGQTLVKQDGIWTAGAGGSGGGGGLPSADDEGLPLPYGLYEGGGPELAISNGLQNYGDELYLNAVGYYGGDGFYKRVYDAAGNSVDPKPYTSVSCDFAGGRLQMERHRVVDEIVLGVDVAVGSVGCKNTSVTTGDSTKVTLSADKIILTKYDAATSETTTDTYLHSGAPLLQRSPDGTIWEGTIDNSGVMTWAPQA